MTKKIYLDAGHGGTDSGATGFGLLEKNINLKIVKYTRDHLNANYSGHIVRLSRSTDKTVSLRDRTNEANKWGADVLVSIHCNAFNGKARGYEDFIYTHTKKSEPLQKAIHKEVSKLFSVNRGKKKANFHMLRESKAVAVLTENGFIDNRQDNNFLKKDNNLKRLGEAHAKGIASYLGLNSKVPKTNQRDSDTIYRVITGSFSNRKNAEKRVNDLKKKGFNSFIDIYKK